MRKHNGKEFQSLEVADPEISSRWKSSRRDRVAGVNPDGSQPHLPCVAFDLAAVLESMRRERVPAAPAGVPVCFFDQDSLAHITLCAGRAERIGLHVLLNSTETPLPVFRYILTHELLHTVIPAREIEGKRVWHPPEFAERERAITPPQERRDAWRWLWLNFGVYLKKDAKRERMIVKRGWQKLLGRPRADLSQCGEMAGDVPDDANVG